MPAPRVPKAAALECWGAPEKTSSPRTTSTSTKPAPATSARLGHHLRGHVHPDDVAFGACQPRRDERIRARARSAVHDPFAGAQVAQREGVAGASHGEQRAERYPHDGGGLLAGEAVHHGENERQAEGGGEGAEDGPDVLVVEQAQEVQVQLVRVGKGVLQGDRPEEREVLGRLVDVVQRRGHDLPPARSRDVPPAVGGDGEEPALDPVAVTQTGEGAHGPEERLLEQILRVSGARRQAHAVAIQPVEVRAHRISELLPLLRSPRLRHGPRCLSHAACCCRGVSAVRV